MMHLSSSLSPAIFSSGVGLCSCPFSDLLSTSTSIGPSFSAGTRRSVSHLLRVEIEFVN
jgi:hypothetical protein